MMREIFLVTFDFLYITIEVHTRLRPLSVSQTVATHISEYHRMISIMLRNIYKYTLSLVLNSQQMCIL